MPIEGDSLARVRELLDSRADPEIAFEVNVRDEEGYLLEAPDVGNNVILVSPRLPERSIDVIRATLGDSLHPV
jgi:hypothetical protein